jgi:mannosylglucosylglycerate synthase
MTNIGFISTRLAGVDGVSLETKKLVDVLTEMGHQCYYCAGELEHDSVEGYLGVNCIFPRVGLF